MNTSAIPATPSALQIQPALKPSKRKNSQTRIKHAVLLPSLFAVQSLLVGCNSSSAGAAQSWSEALPQPLSAVEIISPQSSRAVDRLPIDPAPNADTEKGFALGQRNGLILVERLKQRTVYERGCQAIDDLESALVQVNRSIRPPAHSSTALGRGFFKGYLKAIREELRSVRQSCDESSYRSGAAVGEMLSSLICQAGTLDPEILSLWQKPESSDGADGIEPSPSDASWYSGWSGMSPSLRTSCRETVESRLRLCASAEWTVSIEQSAEVACSDDPTAESAW